MTALTKDAVTKYLRYRWGARHVANLFAVEFADVRAIEVQLGIKARRR